jgi:hypothetical protein
MCRIRTYVLPGLFCLSSLCTIVGNTQSSDSSPNVVLRVTSINYGIGGHQDKRLLVRLTDDGKVEWDKWKDNTWKRETTSVGVQRVSEVQRIFDSINATSVRNKKMGPYHVYMDNSVVLQIRMLVRQEQVTFSVINPFPSNMPPEAEHLLIHKAMPKDVKIIVCEIDKLSSEVANLPVSDLCDTNDEVQ